MRKNCEFCGHPVGKGGDRHRKDRCPPQAHPPVPGTKRHEKMLRRRRKNRRDTGIPARGAPIAGTGRPKGE